MAEKQKRFYDDDVAKEQLQLIDAAREAERQFVEDTVHENTIEQSIKAGRLGNVLGAKALHLYAGRIKDLVPTTVAYSADGQPKLVHSYMLPNRYRVSAAEEAVKNHLEANFEQIYDNAVVEANMDFTNRRSDERIRTPDIVAAETPAVAGEEAEGSTVPSSRYELMDIIPQPKPAVSKPVSLVKRPTGSAPRTDSTSSVQGL